MSKHQGRDRLTDRAMTLPQGTLDLLILKALALEPLHGWAISERLQQISSDALQVGQGSLYPSLHRLERRGWLKARWRTTDAIAARNIELTKKGRDRLNSATENWRRLASVVNDVLDSPEGPTCWAISSQAAAGCARGAGIAISPTSLVSIRNARPRSSNRRTPDH